MKFYHHMTVSSDYVVPSDAKLQHLSTIILWHNTAACATSNLRHLAPRGDKWRQVTWYHINQQNMIHNVLPRDTTCRHVAHCCATFRQLRPLIIGHIPPYGLVLVVKQVRYIFFCLESTFDF